MFFADRGSVASILTGSLGLFLFLVSPIQAQQFGPRQVTARESFPHLSDEPTSAPDKAHISKALSDLPLHFVENGGQIDERVDFSAQLPGYSVFLTGDEAVMVFRQADRSTADTSLARDLHGSRSHVPAERGNVETATVRMQLVGAAEDPKTEGGKKLSGTINYFNGDSSESPKTNVPAYAEVRHEDVYPGVDVKYYGNGGRLEYDFVVAPGTDPSSIQIDFEGAKNVRVGENGKLYIKTPLGEVVQQVPVTYQTIDGERKPVESAYRLAENGQVHFQLGSYDPSKELVIDPVLTFSTYLGGSDIEYPFGISVDEAGAVYVTGYTESTDFPIENAFNDTLGGNQDVFVTKLSEDGSSLAYSTYLGGNDYEVGYGIAVDASGAAYVSGTTSSSSFPVENAFDSSLSGGRDAFVTKLSSDGSSLIFSTYLGGVEGNHGEIINGIEVDDSGNAYVTGQTDASDFPLEDAFDSSMNGEPDAFVTKFSADGASLVFSTYLGGSGGDRAKGISLDAQEAVYVSGSTSSADFPLENAFQDTYGGDYTDAFVTKLTPSGGALAYSTYLGGSGFESAQGIAVDGSDAAYITGTTSSSDFPLENPFDDTENDDVFVTKINPDGATLAYSTYLGGSDREGPVCSSQVGIDVSSSGRVSIASTTSSSDFPLENAFDDSLGGSEDAFVATLSADGSSLVFGTYLGGSDFEEAHALAVGDSGGIYVTGETFSGDFPLEDAVDSEPVNTEAYVTQLDPDVDVPPVATTFSYPVGSKVNVPERITPETNDLYPDNPEADPKRESSDVGPYWRNAQDVGSYYSALGGLHAGEDWNWGSGTSDRGRAVYATANGQVLENDRIVSDGGPGAGGYAIIIEHEVPSGETYYSLYLHVVDLSSTNGEIEAPSVSGTVEKGEPIARVGDVEAFSSHLDFQIRDMNWDPSGPLYPNANPNGYYSHDGGVHNDGMTAQQVDDAFSLMRQDGLLDASDFIDNRSEAPSGLTATSSDDEVSLSWNALPASDLDGYNVYRSTSSFSDIEDDKKITDSPVEDPSYADGTVDGGTTYYYRVTAVPADGPESGPSGQASATLQSLQLLGLEVNQSVQTWENDITPLVEGKKTIVRAHLQNEGQGSTPVNVKLQGTRDGSSLPDSPKSAFNADNFEAPPSPSEDSVEAIRKRRATMSGSLNFELPSEWLEGTVSLSLVGSNIDCDETPAVNDNCELQVTFEPTGTPKITIFSIAWEDGSGTTRLPEYDINAIRDTLEAMYPVSGIDVVVGGTSFIFTCDKNSCNPPKAEDIIDKINGNQVNDVLEGTFKIDEFYDESHMYLGLVSDTRDDEDGSEGPLGRANEIGGQVAFSVTNEERVPSIVAHEIAHLHGLRHATNETFNGTNEDGDPMGWCGASDSEDREFPGDYLSTDVDIPVDNNGNEIWDGFIGIGPAVNASLAEEVWGVNTKQKKGEQGKVIGTSPYKSSGANAELMSYCTDYNQGAPNIGALWPSDLTYAELREKISSYSGLLAVENSRSSGGRTSAALTASQEEDYLLVKGDINLEDQSLQFRPFSTVTTTPDRADAVAPDSGDYSLQALDESGDVVEEVSFEPSVGVSKTVSDIGSFTIPIQADPAIEEVQVLGDSEESSLSGKSGSAALTNNDVLGSKSASPNSPTVTVQYPNGGEDLSGDEVTLEWSADDADGDSLSYTVKYSRNGGSTWKALATSWPRDSLTVDAGALGGTSDGLIRVQASDGFNTAQDESDGTFGTSNVPPSARIFSPSDGAVTSQSGAITFDGSGSDAEDGPLSGPALTWRTESGDSLGAGETIDISAANFPIGTHTIELVATDSVGASDTASVSIQVSLSNDPSLLASASALVESDSLVGFGSTGTNIDFDSTSGAATVTAELYDSAPIGADDIPQSTVSTYRILINAGQGLTVGPDTEVRFETDVLGGINDPTKVQIYRRPAPGNGPFAALDTQVDSMGTPSDPSDDEIYATVPGFGEFVLASDSEPLPVELSRFDATLDGEDAVRLTWTTASETGNAGFEVQRRAGGAGEGSWTTVGSVEGEGTTTEPTSYRYVDEGLPYEADRLTYRLKQVDTDGSTSYSKEVTVSREVKEAELLGTYPNPARTQATLRYAVPERQDVKIYLYDVLGRRVQTVVDGEREGRHKQQLNTSRLASGVYFLRLRAEGATKTQKLTVVR